MPTNTRPRGGGMLATVAAAALGGALAVGGDRALDRATGSAQAQAPGSSGFTLSVGQLRINQRISSAAVRRGNESLRLLDPIRPGEGGPGTPIGWRTADLRDAAVTASKLADGAVMSSALGDGAVSPAKLADGAVTPAKLADGAVNRQKMANPTLAAVVSAAGTLDRGTGAVSVAPLPAAGEYAVTFERDVSRCAYVVSQGGTTFTTTIGFASAVRRNGDPAGVYVRTHDQTGTAVNRAFHLIVQC